MLGAQSLTEGHWTTREVPHVAVLKRVLFSQETLFLLLGPSID